MDTYEFVGISCLKPSLKKTVKALAEIKLDAEEINAYYELMSEKLQAMYGEGFAWQVTGRTYPYRHGTMQFRGEACRILIHTEGQSAACVIHELAHVVVHRDGKVQECHGPSFAKAFDVLIDHAKGFLY